MSRKGLVYYSDCRPPETLLGPVRRQLQRAATGCMIVSATLKPVDFGRNVVLDLARGYVAMFRQVLAGLDALETDIVFICEHDVLYHPAHFAFVPPRRDTFYYNTHRWQVSAQTGQALHYIARQVSGLCADRDLLRAHYRARVERVERDGFSRRMGFEPGTRQVRHGGIDDAPAASWHASQPNIDIRHADNLTATRWRKEQFRNQKYTEGWTESDSVPGWPGHTIGRFPEFFAEVTRGA